MDDDSSYLAVIEIDEGSPAPARTRELQAMFSQFDPSVTSTPRGRTAIRLHVVADSLWQAALVSVAAVTGATAAEAVALAVMPEADAALRANERRYGGWAPAATWLDDL